MKKYERPPIRPRNSQAFSDYQCYMPEDTSRNNLTSLNTNLPGHIPVPVYKTVDELGQSHSYDGQPALILSNGWRMWYHHGVPKTRGELCSAN